MYKKTATGNPVTVFLLLALFLPDPKSSSLNDGGELPSEALER